MDDSGMNRFIAALDDALDSFLTPLQRKEIKEAQSLSKRIKQDESTNLAVDTERLRELRQQIEDHHRSLQGGFADVYSRWCTLQNFAGGFWIIIMYECIQFHTQPDDDKSTIDNVPYKEFFLIHGSPGQKQKAADIGANGDVEEYESIAKQVYDFNLPELLLDQEYVRLRVEAACQKRVLYTEYHANGQWEELEALLERDTSVVDNLYRFLRQNYITNRPAIHSTQQGFAEHRGKLLQMIKDRPPPPYSQDNAPSSQSPSRLHDHFPRLADFVRSRADGSEHEAQSDQQSD